MAAHVRKANLYRCRRCAFVTEDELDMHAHILERRCDQGSTSYTQPEKPENE